MPETVFVNAINQALHEEMERDESVFIMGEDIKRSIYGATMGLLEEFGEKRVLDTPLSENAFFGAAVGAAAVGMRPVVETLTSFMWVAMDQLVSQAAKMRYMFGGQVNLPVVYRATMYYGGGSAAHHSDRSYPMFMNMPGLKIVAPSNPADMKGLMKTAIRDDDVVIMFEDGTLFGNRGDVPANEDLPNGELLVPFGQANTLREGTDVTVVAIAGSVPHAIAAADELEGDGISVEVIDPRTLVPLDKGTILESVERTGRLVIADPAHKVCSAASEIASIVAEEGFWSLQAPIVKVASEQVHIPYSPVLEKLVYPTKEKIVTAVKRTLE
ncbi:MAG TPA: alpha-ketoacid dehydrogenase subunit beta [Dehalococcoidia bacterium]|nr:alpha-ketoacid dehydrogenase subunit beta [Dehalococcoidia bacterium]HIK98999.1 alpha-ketoacid dehydrogenase subunit beta [Dehalococcoidia bacterium]